MWFGTKSVHIRVRRTKKVYLITKLQIVALKVTIKIMIGRKK